MRVEYADLSLIGDREENQDRVQVIATEQAVLLLAVDGMGGHADGAQAAQLAIETVRDAFQRVTHAAPFYLAAVVVGIAGLLATQVEPPPAHTTETPVPPAPARS